MSEGSRGWKELGAQDGRAWIIHPREWRELREASLSLTLVVSLELTTVHLQKVKEFTDST